MFVFVNAYSCLKNDICAAAQEMTPKSTDIGWKVEVIASHQQKLDVVNNCEKKTRVKRNGDPRENR